VRRPPVWLLDVDGVINTRRPLWGARLNRGTARSSGVDWPIRWAPALTERIARLAATGTVEIRWCSTWCTDADQLETLFGLPELGRALNAAALMNPRGTDATKLAAARAVLAEGRSLIWTDDTAVPTGGPVYEALAATGQALLIRPHPRRGLRPRDLTRIEAFIRSPR